MYHVVQLGYLISSALFIFALHWMNAPSTARKGVYAGVAATSLAVIVTWAEPSVIHHVWIVMAIAAGFLVGVPLSRVPLTAVPQRTALSHAFGGAAAGLVGTAEYYLHLSEGPEYLTPFRMVAREAMGVVRQAHAGDLREHRRAARLRSGQRLQHHHRCFELLRLEEILAALHQMLQKLRAQPLAQRQSPVQVRVLSQKRSLVERHGFL